MVKQREGYKFVILEPAKTWITEGKCAGCGKEKALWKRSTTFKCCCKECTQKYVKDSTYYGWPELRMKAIERDNYRCTRCGKHEQKVVDTTFGHMTWEELKDHYTTFKHTYHLEYIDEEKQKIYMHDPSKYVVDHIHAIALGGEEWDINNLQTLCQECNKPKTKIDAGKIARLRFKEELGKAGQRFFDEQEQNQNI